MKRLLATLSIILTLACFVNAQTSISGAQITFKEEAHDFGTLKQGGDATTEFVFTNTGTEPLIISNAKGSCGCTVPTYPHEPIAPGKSAGIKVKYDSTRLGSFSKSVTITTNAAKDATKVLRISGTVEVLPTSGK